jgi:hypothetical protein
MGAKDENYLTEFPDVLLPEQRAVLTASGAEPIRVINCSKWQLHIGAEPNGLAPAQVS